MKKEIANLLSYLLRTRSKRKLNTLVNQGGQTHPELKGKRFKVAVIGAGAMGRDQCLGLQTVPQAEIVAIVDKKSEALEQLSQRVNLSKAKFYSNVQDLLKNEKVDLICIATNTTSHLNIAQLAIEAGVPRLIVEKPVGNQVAKARKLVNLCGERNVKIAVNQSRRWSNDYAAIKRCIEHGYIGELREIYAVPGPGGVAMVGIHFLDLITYLAGNKISWVIGFLDAVEKPNKRGTQFKDPGGYALIGLVNGGRAYLDTSDDLNRKGKFMVLHGSAGRIEVDERQREWHLINSIFRRQTFQFSDCTKPAEYFAKVAAEMLSEATPSCSIAEGIEALEAVIAVHLSNNRKHTQVFLPLEGEDTELEYPFP